MTTAMNSRQAQVIDPILSTQSRGYSNPEFIGHRLLPYADIPNRSMKVIQFGKGAFRRYVDTRRAPGAPTKRVQFGYEGDPIALKQEALEALVPDEISQGATVPGIDLAAVSIQQVQDIIGLGREVEIATLVRNPALYDANHKVALSGAAKWSNGDSDPDADVKAGREAVRRSIGRYPNVLTLGPAAFNAASEHPAVKERFKYTSSDSVTATMLARYFDLEEVLVGKAVALADTAADTDLADDVWGNDALLSYRPSGSSFLVPAFGYTYRLQGYPAVEQPYYERNCKSWIYPITEEFRPYVTGVEGGFLIQGAA
ncbi:major capsid protein [Xanthobacter sp. VTT E-85241]|uniref:major capsid protein n=1 Tax=Roseixanthobacter finlandensis TaxID=3119922 RepID=UPI003728682B